MLENHHLASAFNVILFKKNCNIMGNLPCDMYKTTRKTIIEIVLNTEISRHFYLMSKLKTKLGNNFPDILNLDDRILVLSICQRVSDSMKIARDSRLIFKKWYEQFFEEFYK